MTIRQENIEKIRAKCIAVNPSILDLKFGCEVFVSGVPGKHIHITKQLGFNKFLTSLGDTVSVNYFGGFDLEIIGRPIQLSDILLAMQKIDSIDRQVWMIDLFGHFKRVQMMTNGALRTDTQATWNLLKPFEEQSDEVIEFISGLI